MLVLDENLPADQRQLLRSWQIHFRVVGVDVGASGDDDDNLLPVLHHLPQPTFATLDRNFFRHDWAHAGYCLAWLDVRRREAAEFIRRFLRHPAFDTQAKRMELWRAFTRTASSFGGWVIARGKQRAGTSYEHAQPCFPSAR